MWPCTILSFMIAYHWSAEFLPILTTPRSKVLGFSNWSPLLVGRSAGRGRLSFSPSFRHPICFDLQFAASIKFKLLIKLKISSKLLTINSWYISTKHAIAMNRHIFFFCHLASLVWSLSWFWVVFRDAVLPDFSWFPARPDDYLNMFFTDPRHGRYCGRYVPGAQDLFARLLLLYS